MIVRTRRLEHWDSSSRFLNAPECPIIPILHHSQISYVCEGGTGCSLIRLFHIGDRNTAPGILDDVFDLRPG